MPEWTDQWPKTAGMYWFYGDPSGNVMREKTDDREVMLVKVVTNATSVFYIGNGRFLYKRECGDYVRWTPAILPELPSE